MKSTSSPLRRGPAAPTISCVVVASYAYEASKRRESDDAPGEEDGKKQSLLQTHTTLERTLHWTLPIPASHSPLPPLFNSRTRRNLVGCEKDTPPRTP